MNFISITYFIFLLGGFFLYWHLPARYKSGFLLLISCLFYAYWDWRFLGLIAVSTVVSFYCGNRISREVLPKKKTIWLLCSIVINIGLLGYFKYFDFFISNVVAILTSLGLNVSAVPMHLILPIGISFYIFQSITYPLDIYARRMSPGESFIDFAAYVTFFPKLIAGPIVRAKDFLDQLRLKKSFSYEDLQEGSIRILTGFFKKAVIADTLAGQLVTPVFSSPGNYTAATIWLAMVGYAIQIYADFSGYSNIAIGSARIFGLRINENFAFPYLSTNFSDFWRRWHVTMSTFFRDYIYIPLGGNRCSRSRVFVNLFVTMLLCGLWHGAAWTFVVWGGIHGLLLIANRFVLRLQLERWIGKGVLSIGLAWIVTQLCICLAWIFFRSENFENATTFLYGLFAARGSEIVCLSWQGWACIAFFMIDHIYGWLTEHKEKMTQAIPLSYRAFVYTAMVIIAYYGVPAQKSQFIYFQF